MDEIKGRMTFHISLTENLNRSQQNRMKWEKNPVNHKVRFSNQIGRISKGSYEPFVHIIGILMDLLFNLLPDLWRHEDLDVLSTSHFTIKNFFGLCSNLRLQSCNLL